MASGISTIVQTTLGMRLALLQGTAFAYIPSVHAFMQLPEQLCNATTNDYVPQEVYEGKMALVGNYYKYPLIVLEKITDPRLSTSLFIHPNVNWFLRASWAFNEVYRSYNCESVDLASDALFSPAMRGKDREALGFFSVGLMRKRIDGHAQTSGRPLPYSPLYSIWPN